MKDTRWAPRKGYKRRVVVIGAGVAGMTAAHELVERGYEVEVVEMSGDSADPALPRIGGMARSSWARVPPPPDRDHPPSEAQDDKLPDRLFTDDAPPPADMTLKELLGSEGRADTFLRSLKGMKSQPRKASQPASARGNTKAPVESNESNEANEPNEPKDHVSVITSVDLTKQQLAKIKAAFKGYTVHWQRAPALAGSAPKEAQAQISMEGSRVAGEHGFRFFPSFYNHMFDTMKRIPIQEAAIGNVSGGSMLTTDSPRTAFDALLSAEFIQLGLEPRGTRDRSFDIPRRPMRSLQEIRAFFAHVLEDAGYRGQDLFRLASRYAEYLTSAALRRTRQYENMSWSAFLGLDDPAFSRYFEHHVNSGAQALVAMSSRHNDARTIGSIAMQLTLDQVRGNASGYTDATLRGPTSIELFEPWQVYLDSQDVRFTRAELVGFYGYEMAVRPAFGMREPSADDKSRPGLRAFKLIDIAPADYYVVTIPIDKFQALFERIPSASWEVLSEADPHMTHRGPSTTRWTGGDGPDLLSGQDLVTANQLHLEIDKLEDHHHGKAAAGETDDDIAKYLGFSLGDVTARPDSGPLRYMCGIQFYFPADVRLILGHTVCLDSAWGVSYISQVQYWQDHIRHHGGVRGIFSAIFTLFEVPACDLKGENPLPAMKCDADGIAERVWKQILDAWDEAKFGKLPNPEYYYLDESLHYDKQRKAWINDTPYLVNRVGDWHKRGGVRLSNCDYIYRMQLGHTVFAGAFMRTETRLNTMEASNESARRAVNAILDYDNAPHQLCKVWNIEDHEIPEARPLRELDARVFRRGGHHILRHPAVDTALRVVPWDLFRLGLPTRRE